MPGGRCHWWDWGDPGFAQTLSPVLLLVSTMVPLLHGSAGVRSLERDPMWGSHSITTSFLGQTNPDATRRTTNVHSLFWMLLNAVMFILFLIRHLNLSTTLAMNTQCDCLQCAYAQGMELNRSLLKSQMPFQGWWKQCTGLEPAQRVSEE